MFDLLCEAFDKLSGLANVRLLLVGPYEDSLDPISPKSKEIIEQTVPLTEKLSMLSGLPCVMTTIEDRHSGKVNVENPFPIRLQKKYYN